MDPDATRLFWHQPAAFRVELVVSPDQSVDFSPSFEQVEEMCVDVLHHFTLAVQGLPRVEAGQGGNAGVVQVGGISGRGGNAGVMRICHSLGCTPPHGLFINLHIMIPLPQVAPSKDQEIPTVQLGEQCVTRAVDRVRAIVRANTQAPHALARLFDDFMFLVPLDVRAHCEEFNKSEPSLDQYTDELERFQKAAAAIQVRGRRQFALFLKMEGSGGTMQVLQCERSKQLAMVRWHVQLLFYMSYGSPPFANLFMAYPLVSVAVMDCSASSSALQATCMADVRTGLFEVSAAGFKQLLVDKANAVVRTLLEEIRRANAQSNQVRRVVLSRLRVVQSYQLCGLV